MFMISKPFTLYRFLDCGATYSTVVLEHNRELYGISLQNEGMYCLQPKLCFFLVSLVYFGLSQSLLSCSFVILSFFGGIFPGLKV